MNATSSGKIGENDDQPVNQWRKDDKSRATIAQIAHIFRHHINWAC